MYFCKLKFFLVNCNEMNETIESIQPLKNFSHEFYTCDSIDEISPDDVDLNTVIILNKSQNLTANQILEYKKNKATLVLLLEDMESLMESVLNLFDYIWSSPLTPPFMRHHFKKIQYDMKLKKDFWLSKNYLDALIKSIPEPIWFKRKDGVHVKVNDAFCEAINKNRDEIIGYTSSQIDAEGYDRSDGENEVMNSGTTIAFHEEEFNKERGLIQYGVYKTPIKDEFGNSLGLVGFAQDITKLLQQQDTISKMSDTDSLTQLTTGKYLREYIKDNRGINQLTICNIDLDNLKLVNEKYDNTYGDIAIRGTADVLLRVFPDALVTRYAGDSFFVTIVGNYKSEDLTARLDYLIEKANEFYHQHEELNSLSMSIGVASINDSEISLDELLSMCEEALFYCKAHNRGRYIIYDDIKN